MTEHLTRPLWLSESEWQEATRRCISIYQPPITQTQPCGTASLWQLWRGITGPRWQEATQQYRQLLAQADPGCKQAMSHVRRRKGQLFGSATMSGRFDGRKDEGLLEHSGLLTMDIDHIHRWQASGTLFAARRPDLPVAQMAGVEGLRYALLTDEELALRLLFRSPSGDGLKVVVAIDLSLGSHAEWFEALSHYMLLTYGVQVDASGRNVARCCFLPHDPDAVLFRIESQQELVQQKLNHNILNEDEQA